MARWSIGPLADFNTDFIEHQSSGAFPRGACQQKAAEDCRSPRRGTSLDNIDEPDCCGVRALGGATLVWINGPNLNPALRAVFEVPAAGEHTLHFWMREDGMILDKMLVTTNTGFVPIGSGPPETPRGAGVAPRFSPSVLSAGKVMISWTGAGTLQQTDSLSPPDWRDAPSQVNPMTVQATGTRFYRVRP
jgi:hypothetical protein